MEYKKPCIVNSEKNLPPVTVNFAPPAVGTSESVNAYKDEIGKTLESVFGISPNFGDKRLSEAAKQI